jgi:ABC-type multidrug transport system fused ATPase/permease subunit
VALLTLLGRSGALAAALLYVRGDSRSAVGIAAFVAAIFVGRRVMSMWARLDVERDLHCAAARALLRSDVIEEPEEEPHFALTSGLYYGADAIANTAPGVVADLLATAGASFVLSSVLPSRLLFVCVAAAAVVGVTTLLLRSRIAVLYERATAAQERLGDALAATLHGRLEIVSANVEAGALTRVSERADGYVKLARRSALGGAVLGRAPLGAAVAAGGALAALGFVDAREVWGAGISSAVVLGAALPPALGVVFGAQELLRLTKRLRPFARLVLRPERPDLTERRDGGEEVRVPAPVTLDRVAFAYGRGGPNVIEDASFEWPTGPLVLRGPNGSGKSTVLRLLLGLRDPSAGTICVDALSLREIDRASLRRRFAYLPQRPYLGEPYTTVAESFRLTTPEVSNDRMHSALERTGLAVALGQDGADPLSRRIGQLSVGQRQRLGLARVLTRDAAVILLDEPDANLDREGIALLASLIEELSLEGRMVAVAAHGPIAESIRGVTWELRRPATVAGGRDHVGAPASALGRERSGLDRSSLT